ncbi:MULTISPECIES: DUF1992 domain-containing protein [unclassified Curtobacterium]|jgi:hypothetical protein|uniref:DnaJ family domain-containing protein n=1 Tax=unclassified Curtobacterium TaxID=257496 RepID=UPI001AE6AA0E|nr:MULTISPECIES: DUF1992 domain-containing protein [unclassified Curtobacterium]MBP1301518.1 hypothetical protein [Curtobacterium sp. 1310]MCM3521022.1 DUF1992 domain-containing protein [Curtobacterium sp. P97]MDB6428433.1 DUF1992 domain-containing protein [Curtobacterium sp. 20TX0008]MDP9737724.1 hypothetical protein [Curtobacterium sp. 260]MDT0210421.1 DUF1992 domain-containing protein [Curtobacterium sp. BRD11]
MNDVDARMDRLRRAARYRYQQLVDSEIERGSLDPDEVREERRLLRLQDVERHARARIEEAERRGVFEGNPYHGKPLPGNDGRHDPDWWIKAKIEREDIRGIAPPALALRTEDAELDDHLDALTTEDDVRAVLVDFNARVKEARRQLLGGPPVVTPMRDVDVEVERWRERRDARRAADERAAADRAAAEQAARPRRWWRRA